MVEKAKGGITAGARLRDLHSPAICERRIEHSCRRSRCQGLLYDSMELAAWKIGHESFGASTRAPKGFFGIAAIRKLESQRMRDPLLKRSGKENHQGSHFGKKHRS